MAKGRLEKYGNFSVHPGYTVLGWVQILVAECNFRLHHEEDPHIRGSLQAIKEHAESLHKFCRKQIDPTPTALTKLFKRHLFDELDKVVPSYEKLGYIQLMTEIGKRDPDNLPPGRSPHYSNYFVGVFREDAEGKDSIEVARVPVLEADDPGINLDTMLPLVCLWLRGYAEKAELGVRFDSSVKEYAEHF